MNYLAAIRKKHGASQQEVADYLGVTRQGYGNYETSAREPDFETLLKLGEFFQVTIDEILRGPDQSKQLDISPGTIKNAPTNLGVDEKGYGLLSAYTENKEYLDESDTEDIELFIRMKAERKKAKDAAGKDSK